MEALIGSTMLYNQVCYISNPKKADMEQLDKVAKTAAKTMGTVTAAPITMHRSVAVKKLHRILLDTQRPSNRTTCCPCRLPGAISSNSSGVS